MRRSLGYLWMGIVCYSPMIAAINLSAAEVVIDKEHGFSVTLPEGFEPATEFSHPGVRYAFQLPPVDEDQFGTYVLFSPLDSKLSRNNSAVEALIRKRNPQIEAYYERWNDHAIVVFRVPERFEELDLLNLNAQVPLESAGLQVSVLGDAIREEELRGILRSVLGKLRGQASIVHRSTLDDGRAQSSDMNRLSRRAGLVLVVLMLAVITGLCGLLVYGTRRSTSTELTIPPTEPGSPG